MRPPPPPPPPSAVISPRAASVPRCPNCGSVVDDLGDAAAAEEIRHHLGVKIIDVVSRFERCHAKLADARNEAAELRRENVDLRQQIDVFLREIDDLRWEKENLACRISINSPSPGIGSELPDDFTSLRRPVLPISINPPSPGIGSELPDHFTSLRQPAVPKSINVPSPGYDYLKLHGKHPSSPTNSGSRMFLDMDGGVKGVGEEDWDNEEQAFEVHNQGCTKTELCKIWEQIGSCPYGDQCKFAHGTGELRPVIRHPRYRTDVCRMFRAGEVCRYGDRCHFRHDISPADLP